LQALIEATRMGVSGDNVASVGDCSTSSSTSGASNWSGFNAALGRASAAACLCSLATGWTFGRWLSTGSGHMYSRHKLTERRRQQRAWALLYCVAR
jgi:hypothetical protein